jgi:hypothetical protein
MNKMKTDHSAVRMPPAREDDMTTRTIAGVLLALAVIGWAADAAAQQYERCVNVCYIIRIDCEDRAVRMRNPYQFTVCQCEDNECRDRCNRDANIRSCVNGCASVNRDCRNNALHNPMLEPSRRPQALQRCEAGRENCERICRAPLHRPTGSRCKPVS